MAIYLTSDSNIDVATVGATALNWYTNGSSTQILRVADVGMYNNTSGSSANCRISSTPSILRSTASSRNIKKDVENLWDSQADIVLNLRPVKYFSRNCGVEDIRIKNYGFIAEEVGLLDPRLVDWRFVKEVEDQWSDNGETIYEELDPPEAEGVDYQKIPVLLTNIVKRQKLKVEDLQQKLLDVETSISQLEVE